MVAKLVPEATEFSLPPPIIEQAPATVLVVPPAIDDKVPEFVWEAPTVNLESTVKVVPSNVKLASPLIVELSTDVITLLLPVFV